MDLHEGIKFSIQFAFVFFCFSPIVALLLTLGGKRRTIKRYIENLGRGMVVSVVIGLIIFFLWGASYFSEQLFGRILVP